MHIVVETSPFYSSITSPWGLETGGHGDSWEGTLMDLRLSSHLHFGVLKRDSNSCSRMHIWLEFRLSQEGKFFSWFNWKNQAHSRDTRGKTGSISFFPERNFVLIRHNWKTHQLPHFFSCQQSLFPRLCTCNNTEILPICNLPRKGCPVSLPRTDTPPLTLTERSSLNIAPYIYTPPPKHQKPFSKGAE